MTGWLIDRSIDRLIDWSIDWLIYLFIYLFDVKHILFSFSLLILWAFSLHSYVCFYCMTGYI